MSSLIDRYIAKEILQTLIAVIVVLLLIFTSVRLVRYLADVASGDLPADIIWVLLGVKAVAYLVTITPLALYLAILLVLGRLYRDNEMTALAAGGIGQGKLAKIVLMIALPFTAIHAWITVELMPKTVQYEYKIIAQAEQNLELVGLTPGRFREATSGERVTYVEEVSEDNKRLKNIFVYLKHNARYVLLAAANARVERNAAGDRFIVLENGHRYDGVPGQADYRITHYKEHGIKITTKLSASKVKTDSIPTARLWGSPNRWDEAELHWRWSLPFTLVFLALLAVPLGKLKPRQGRFAKLALGIFVFLLYFGLLTSAKAWLGQGKLPSVFGLWWVHVLVASLTAYLMFRQHRPGGWQRSHRPAA